MKPLVRGAKWPECSIGLRGSLYDVLRDCHLRGAALDVFAQEPFGDKRFMNLDNVIMTPHAGAYTDEATERTLLMVAEDVLHVLRGEEPEHMVV